MEQYKNLTVRYINGYTVTSKSLVLTEEEEKQKACEVRAALNNIAKNRVIKEKTA